MFVGQVPKSMDEDQLREMFEEFGRVHSINVLRDKVTGVSKGNWIRFCLNFFLFLSVFLLVGWAIVGIMSAMHGTFSPSPIWYQSIPSTTLIAAVSTIMSFPLSLFWHRLWCVHMYASVFRLFARTFYLQFLPSHHLFVHSWQWHVEFHSIHLLASIFIVLIIVWRTDFSSHSNFTKLSVKQTCMYALHVPTPVNIWIYQNAFSICVLRKCMAKMFVQFYAQRLEFGRNMLCPSILIHRLTFDCELPTVKKCDVMMRDWQQKQKKNWTNCFHTNNCVYIFNEIAAYTHTHADTAFISN